MVLAQMNWEKEYIEDEIEMDLNLFLLSGLVIYKTFYLVALKKTQPRLNRAMGSETN